MARAMDITLPIGSDTHGEVPNNSQEHQLPMATLAVEREGTVGKASDAVPTTIDSSASSSIDAQQTSSLGNVAYEPLKVCLDDDSSIEDDEEDMFDDDAFTFGDEDFEALMSHESMKRVVSSSNKTHALHVLDQTAVTSATDAAPNAPLPLHHHGAPSLIAASSSSAESSPSTSQVREDRLHHGVAFHFCCFFFFGLDDSNTSCTLVGCRTDPT